VTSLVSIGQVIGCVKRLAVKIVSGMTHKSTCITLSELVCELIRSHLAKYSVPVVELRRCSQREEELTTIVVGLCVRHGNETTTDETQSRMQLILQASTYIYSVSQKKSTTPSGGFLTFLTNG